MKKTTKLLAAAIAATAGASAHAQSGPTSEVVVYGLAMPFLEQVKTSGATTTVPTDRPTLVSAASYTGLNDPSRMRMTVGTTQLGFRGFETIAPGLRVVWQLESAFQIDQNVGPGLGARNSKVGLAGGWGEVNFGQWDSPYKFISLPINPFRAGYVFDYTAIMGNPGLSVPGTTTQLGRAGAKPDAAFDRRNGNTVQYWTPTMGGFAARFAWTVDEGKTTATATTASIAPQIWSAALRYQIGNLTLAYGYEQHDDFFGLSALNAAAGSAPASLTNTSSKDKAHKVTGMWTIGGTRITGAFEQLEYTNGDSAADAIRSYKRKAWYLSVEQKFSGGNQSIYGSYGEADDGSCSRNGALGCLTGGMGAKYYVLGYIYRFSKRTEVFAAYYNLDNKGSGTYSPFPFVGTVVAPGADTTGAGVGIIHYF
jgi:predicted porin